MSTFISANSYPLHTSHESACALAQSNERTITARFRNPSRTISVNIPNTAWEQLDIIPEQYRALVDGVLVSAAKSIVSRFYMNTWEQHRITVGQMPANLLTPDALLEEAAGNNSDWLTKEELQDAWKDSATRASIYNAQRYATERAYQRAFTRYEELILKLAGKTSSYTPKDIDAILAKLADDDLPTAFGQFVVRRCEAIRNKPQSADVDMDVL